MKRSKVRFFCAALGAALLCAALAACVGGPPPVSAAPSGADELDAAIREASTYLNGRVPKSSKAVFLNIRSDYPDLSEYLLNVLSENAVNDGVFSVVDRQQLDTIRAELDFQMSGEVSDESAQNIGQMLGAQTIVSGAVSKVGSLYRLQVKAIEVQSAGVQGQWSRNIPNGATIAALTEKYAPAPAAIAVGARSGAAAAPAAGGGAAVPVQAAVPEAEAPAVTYKIGDAGPAGGIIFYDKGNDSGGWRYLEAAPASTEWTKIAWSTLPSATDVKGTNIEIGTGKQNTQTIVNYSLNNGVSCRAAMLCDNLRSGGYDDWFLPSRGELNLLFVYLREAGIGGFKGDRYWSSSIGNGGYVWAQYFSNGSQTGGGNNTWEFLVRAIRQF